MTSSPDRFTVHGHGRGRAGNPFRASQTRPGTLPFLFLDGGSLEPLVNRFLDQGRRGQIVGPHGSGKSTLMMGLLACLHAQDIAACHLRIDSQRGWQRSHWCEVRRASSGTVVAIDGYDQLPWQARMRLRMIVAWRSLGLLVTAHRVHSGLPVLHATSMDEHIARQVVQAYLDRAAPNLAKNKTWPILLADLPARLRKHQGNLREVLFDLYEEYQAGPSVP